MEMKDVVDKVEGSVEYKKFISENEGYFLATVFNMKDKNEEQFQAGYYSKENDDIIVFDMEPIKKLPADKVFKKEGDSVHRLEINDVKLTLVEAKKIAAKIINTKYANELITKEITILQHLEKLLYNMTYVTQTFNVINIKIDAINSEILMEHKHSILDLGSVQQGGGGK